MANIKILTILILLPIIGLLLMLLVKQVKQKLIISVCFSGLTLALSLYILPFINAASQAGSGGFIFVESYSWFSFVDIKFQLGVDGLSILFIILTALLTPICLIVGYYTINTRVTEFFAAFLLLESLVIGAFLATDLLVFYLFFESMLIPMFLIIGIWGAEQRVQASFKFFLYTLAGSVLFLAAIIYLLSCFSTTDINSLYELAPTLDPKIQKLLWLALFASFAIKVPIFPFHTWLPSAHVQAPTSGSVMLAGILLKLGGYGFIRFSLPLFPEASLYFADFVIILSIVSIIYGSLIAFAQEDMKKLIAYSSVAHMGYVTAGVFSLNTEGLTGAILQMLSHGIISASLFLCIGVLYERAHSKLINIYGGLAKIMPVFAFMFMLFVLGSIALPGTSGFIAEVLSLIGIFKINKIYSMIASTGMVLGAIYMLWLYARLMYGVNKQIEASAEYRGKFHDLKTHEFFSLLILATLMLFIGVYSSYITSLFSGQIAEIVNTIGETKLNNGVN